MNDLNALLRKLRDASDYAFFVGEDALFKSLDALWWDLYRKVQAEGEKERQAFLATQLEDLDGEEAKVLREQIAAKSATHIGW